ncbi:hypothetical protein C8R45DRAFT_943585 [Mycena sanguinolenta]|nr:hypothetical protein C8R45DRAFT_943585 [Mycena sanguinolenta]
MSVSSTVASITVKLDYALGAACLHFRVRLSARLRRARVIIHHRVGLVPRGASHIRIRSSIRKIQIDARNRCSISCRGCNRPQLSDLSTRHGFTIYIIIPPTAWNPKRALITEREQKRQCLGFSRNEKIFRVESRHAALTPNRARGGNSKFTRRPYGKAGCGGGDSLGRGSKINSFRIERGLSPSQRLASIRTEDWILIGGLTSWIGRYPKRLQSSFHWQLGERIGRRVALRHVGDYRVAGHTPPMVWNRDHFASGKRSISLLFGPRQDLPNPCGFVCISSSGVSRKYRLKYHFAESPNDMEHTEVRFGCGRPEMWSVAALPNVVFFMLHKSV